MKIEKQANKVFILNSNHQEVAYVLFPNIDEKTVVIKTTFVDASLRGQKIASLLMQATYEVLKEKNLKAILECSYAKDWFLKHPDCHDALK